MVDVALVWWTSHWCGGRRTGVVNVAQCGERRAGFLPTVLEDHLAARAGAMGQILALVLLFVVLWAELQCGTGVVDVALVW